MDAFKDKASVQYGDYSGYVSFDGHEGPMLHQLCRDREVDEKYFPIAFELFEHSLREVPYQNEADLTIYAGNKEEAGNSFDEISAHIKNNGGKVKVTKIELSISYTDLSKYFKRMGLFAMQGDLDKIIREFDEEEEL